MQQAIKLSQEENGEVESWDTTLNGHQFFEKYMANYVKWMKEYTTSELKKEAPRTLLNGSSYTGTTYNGGNSAHFTLINGSMISMNLNSAGEYGLRPLGEAGTPGGWRFPGGKYSRSVVKGTNGNACAKGKSGYWCSSLIAQDGWQIEDDYPWKGK